MNKVPSVRGIGAQMRFIQGHARLGLLLGSLLLIITTGLFAYMAVAATSLGKPIYGPETFNRGLYFRFFQVAAPTGPYTLTVQNGSATGQNRVDSAVITLNAKVVVGLRDLTAKTASVSKTVTLNKLNLLTFLVTGKKGSFITFSINGQTANTAPVANAGADQSGQLNGTVTLDGSASSDFDGDLLTYNWNLTTKPAGSTALLTNPNTANPTLFLDKSGTYVGSLVVNDGLVNSSPDTVIVSTLNVTPVADAGSNQRARVNTTATLDGSGSTDADGDPLTYAWSFTAKPTGSVTQLSNTTAVKPTFTVDKPGTYALQLVVSDGKANSQAAQVTVTTENSPPEANAGADQSTALNTLVTLDGSASSDVDGDLLTYAWSFTSLPTGSTATLSDPTAVMPTFTVDKPGSYTLQLLVKDGVVESLADTVVITTLNSKPVANAGTGQTVTLNQLVNLDGQNSTDADSDTLTYAWTLTTKPTGSTATLLNPTSQQPSFTADKAGTYVAQLIVNDGTVDSDPATVTISTLNSKPVANAGVDQTAPFNTLVNLDGTGSTDADDNILTYAWSFTSKPIGSNATLTGNTTATPRFTGDVSGTYVIELIVNDSKEASNPDTVTITVEAAVPVNVPPEFTSIPVTQATEGEGYSYQVTAIDGNSDALTYALTNNPPQGMTITGTGLITWIPNATQVGDFPITVTVTDGKSPPVEQSFTITVKAATVTVPDVVGQTQAAAQAAITGANLTVGTITQASSATVPAGNVISQNPAANVSVAKNTAIALEISTGPASGGGNLPPDPATVAPPIDPTVATTTFAATQFLYTGNNPIQTGVAAGTIEAKRAAVIRGKVMDKTNAPLSGVTITILNHPEFGQTLSRADGMFDMAVNGGGILTVNYKKTGYLPAQRQVNSPWQDYVYADDAILIQQDTKLNTIDLTNTTQAFQVARGNPITDADGTRQATLLIPQGTQAQVYNPDGTTRTVTSLNLRLTEYTVGDNGPETMPGPLPPTSAYTYAFEMKADEANTKIEGKDVLFDRPVPFYINNFLNFPVGTSVPVGYYNKDKAAWMPSENGKVIKILVINNGIADIDSNGDDVADDAATLAAFGITDQERTQLAGLYTSGQTLWRVQVNHLSTWDCNWPFKMPDDAIRPNGSLAAAGDPQKVDNAKEICNSVVECENQILRETIPITGSNFTLNYASDRVGGNKVANSVTIPLSGAQIPASTKRIDLDIKISGRRFQQSFTPQTNQKFTFLWDGSDAFGRSVKSSQRASIRIGYAYDPVYATPAQLRTAFAQFSGTPLEGSRARNEVRIFSDQSVTIGAFETAGGDVASWSLSSHHSYDPIGKVLYLGDGTRRSATALTASSIQTRYAGSQVCGFSGDGSLATNATLSIISGLSFAPDGSLFISDSGTGSNRIRKVSSDGIISAYAGNGQTGFSGDGGPAAQATFGALGPKSNIVGSDGTLYVVDRLNNRIRKVSPSGIISTFVGNGQVGFSGDGGAATSAALFINLAQPVGLALDRDGSLYFSDSGNFRVRKVSPDGIISTVAGKGTALFSGDGGPATQAGLAPYGLALSSEGDLYIADAVNGRVRKISSDGIITTVAGNNNTLSTGDGGLALNTRLISPYDVAIDVDSSLLIVERSNRIRKVTPDGVISTVAGGGTGSDFSNNGSPATAVDINAELLAVDKAGNIFYDSTCGVTRVSTGFSGFGGGEIAIPSENGAKIYRFNANGRHLSTINAYTGATLLTFGYDVNGNLTTVTDGGNLVTTIERDANGKPTAIIAPFGQRTTLALEANGYLANLTNPANEAHEMTYSADGLLTSFIDPRSNASTFNYDPLGRLSKDTNAVTGSLSLARNELTDGHSVAVSTGLSRVTRHSVRNLAVSDRERTHLQPDNTSSTSLEKTNGTTTTTTADGSLTTLTEGPDPRFSMLAPIPQSNSLATGGLTLNSSLSRTVELETTGDPLSLTTLTDTATVNGRTSRLVYNQADKTFTANSAANRTSRVLIDNLGRTLRTTVTDINPVSNTYDPQGRPATISQGTGVDERLVNFTYNPQGYLASVTDPISRQAKYEYDLAGRVTKQILPDNREILFAYDAKGNLTSLAPPGKPAHGFTHNAIDQVTAYRPPVVSGSGTTNTLYEYDLDKALTKITRPDALTINFTHDTAGRLSTLTTPEGDTTYSYNATTGKLSGIAAPGNEGLAYTYNGALLTQTAATGTITGTVGYGYDNDFRVTSINVNGANPFTYGYDNDSLLTAISNTALGINFTLTRNAQNGLLTGTTLGSLTDAYTYNGFAEMTSYLARQGATDLYKTDFIRDKLGRITRKTETIAGVVHTYDYAYDIAGRLIEVKQDNLVQSSYGYDDNGNRTFLNGLPIADYDAQDRLLRYNNITYDYTANGELKTKTIGTATTSYRYDVLGNLRSVTLSDGTVLDYVIDGQNRRIGKKRNGVLEQGIIYQSHLKPIAELDGSGNIVSRFVYGIGVNSPDFMFKGGVTYRLIKDHLGSPRLVFNTATNTIAQRLDYDAWGNVTADTNPGFQPFGFAGGIYDRDTGLLRFGARDYDPIIARWLSKDKLAFLLDSLNRFEHVHSDPINLIDVDGLMSRNSDHCKRHYERNKLNKPPADLTTAEICGRKSTIGESVAHRLGTDRQYYVKYTFINADGSSHEGIYDQRTGALVNDPAVMGSYNYVDPSVDPWGHYVQDVDPWIVCGNSPDDPTTELFRQVLFWGEGGAQKIAPYLNKVGLPLPN